MPTDHMSTLKSYPFLNLSGALKIGVPTTESAPVSEPLTTVERPRSPSFMPF